MVAFRGSANNARSELLLLCALATGHGPTAYAWAVGHAKELGSMRLAVLSFPALLVSSMAQAAEPKLVVATDPQSQPESVTVAPDGSLFLSSASKPVIYRAAKGASQARIFFDASAEGNVSF